MGEIWAGIDCGKREHHCVVIDEDGTVLFSQRLSNDEDTLLALIGQVAEIACGWTVTWATDLNAGGAALLLAVLADHGQHVLYIPGGSFTMRPPPTKETPRPMRRTRRSSPIRHACAAT